MSGQIGIKRLKWEEAKCDRCYFSSHRQDLLQPTYRAAWSYCRAIGWQSVGTGGKRKHYCAHCAGMLGLTNNKKKKVKK